MTEQQTRIVIAAAICIAALAWLDPVFIPLVLLGPVASGLVAGRRGVRPRPVATTWFVAGMLMLVSDLIINREDVAFHAAVAVITAGISAAFTVLGGRLQRRDHIAA